MSDPSDDLVTPSTREVEEEDANIHGRADRMPTPEEEEAAESNKLDPSVADAYEKANERGANVKGEGQID